MQVEDHTDECERLAWRDIDKRDPRTIELLILHRIENSEHPSELMDLFADVKLGTGGRFPYHFVIRADGCVQQCVPLSIKAPGAKGANSAGVQIALFGDFRKAAPSPAQLESLYLLGMDFLRWNPKLRVEGHTDAPGRSADPDKVCPGQYLVAKAVALMLARRLEAQGKSVLKVKGVRF